MEYKILHESELLTIIVYSNGGIEIQQKPNTSFLNLKQMQTITNDAEKWLKQIDE